MLNASSLRYRYTQFFVLFMLCSIVYVMANSIGQGITNFQDHLYKKDFLMEEATLLRMKIGDRIFPQALQGKEGWVEYTGEGSLDDFQNVTTFENKKKLIKELTTLKQYLKSQGITLLIVVAPNKSTIYPDKLPEQLPSLHTQSRLDKFILYLENNYLSVIDLRPALWAARQDQDVYYKTNTHWNGYGAFAAYTTIINSLGISYPDLKPYKTADLELVTTAPTIQDISRVMQANFITEPGLFFKPKKPFVQTLHPSDIYGFNQSSWIPESKLPILLMFHDSFGAIYLNDYLSMNFQKSYFVHNYSMTEYLTREKIQYFKPDIIIIEIAERKLQFLPGYLSGFTSE